MTEKEYMDVKNLVVVRTIRDALKWSFSDVETKPHFDKMHDAVSDLAVILNKRVTTDE